MLEDLLLTKEEIPIFPYMSCVVPMCVFNVPIHHSLLSVDVKIDPELANKLFPEAAREWYKDFQAYLTALEKSESEEDKEEKEKLKWYKEVFLPLGETVSIDLGRQCLGEIKLWQDLVAVTENGFARVLSINRNAGGSLIFNPEAGPEYIGSRFVKFSEEKFKAYNVRHYTDSSGRKIEMPELPVPGSISYVYELHNVDHYPGALFLRDWAILYLNVALKEVHKD